MSKIICIANHSTAQAKYWNNLNGWQEVVNYCKNKGYEVILISKEDDYYMGNKNPYNVTIPEDKSIKNTIKILRNANAFIGLSSGLSWLAWSLNIPTILISGFSEAYTEACDYRILPMAAKCTGCFNKVKLDSGDWNWCPFNKGTSNQFECTRNISSYQVIDVLEKYIFNKI